MEKVRYSQEETKAITLKIEYRGDLYEIVLVDDENGGYGAIMNWGITFKIPAYEQDQEYIYWQIQGKDIFDEGCRIIGQVVMMVWFKEDGR